MEKLFVVRKYVKAANASQALKKEKNIKADDVWLDEDWKKNYMDEGGESKKKVGF